MKSLFVRLATLALLSFSSVASATPVANDSHALQGVKPDFVIVYIGPTVKFLTTAPDGELALEHEESLKAIARHAQDLNNPGVRHEVCAVATKVFNVDNATILPSMHLAGDGFISLIGWQTQGYKLVPLF